MLNLRQFVSPAQLSVLRGLCSTTTTEEWKHFVDTMEGLKKTIASMPKTYETDGQGDAAVAYLHYFSGGSDWWVTERDMGCQNADGSWDMEQTQAFGLVCLNDWEPEHGYISIAELIKNGVELDLYWTPKTVGEIKEALCR